MLPVLENDKHNIKLDYDIPRLENWHPNRGDIHSKDYELLKVKLILFNSAQYTEGVRSERWESFRRYTLNLKDAKALHSALGELLAHISETETVI